MKKITNKNSALDVIAAYTGAAATFGFLAGSYIGGRQAEEAGRNYVMTEERQSLIVQTAMLTCTIGMGALGFLIGLCIVCNRAKEAKPLNEERKQVYPKSILGKKNHQQNTKRVHFADDELRSIKIN